MLVFLPLDWVGEVFFFMACCILQIGAGARVMVMSSRSAFLSREWLMLKSSPASVGMFSR